MTRVTLKQIRDGLKEGITLFFVHASWCPYTVQFYPIFEKVMNNLKGKGMDNKFQVIKIDDVMTKSIRSNYSDIYKSIAEYDEYTDEYRLSFPTVVMFVDGKRYKYKVNVRTVQNLESFIVGKLTKQSRKNKNTKIQRNETGNKRRVNMSNNSNRRISTRPTKLLTLQDQIDKAFQKLFK